MTSLQGAVVLVTGGNRGLGKAVVDDLLGRGVAKIYATSRKPEPSTDPRVVTLPLEVTDQASIEALAEAAPDVTVLVNNAGLDIPGNSYLGSPIEDVRQLMEVNFFGPLQLTRAFVPVIERNGGGQILNMLSAVAWVAQHGAYSATKSAFWSQSNALRVELLGKGIGVTSLHMGYVDTDMAATVAAPKENPADIAKAALDGVESGAHEVLADATARFAKGAPSAAIEDVYAALKA